MWAWELFHQLLQITAIEKLKSQNTSYFSYYFKYYIHRLQPLLVPLQYPVRGEILAYRIIIPGLSFRL